MAQAHVLQTFPRIKDAVPAIGALVHAAGTRLPPSVPLVVVFDIDDTVINIDDEPIDGIADVFRAIDEEYPHRFLAFVTARSTSIREETEALLRSVGMASYDMLLLCPPEQRKTSAQVRSWKAAAREQVAAEAARRWGLSSVPVALSFGDQWWDVLDQEPAAALRKAVPRDTVALLRVAKAPLLWGIKLPDVEADDATTLDTEGTA